MQLGGGGGRLDANWVRLSGVGLLGAFTMMSAYSFETSQLWSRGDHVAAAAYVAATALVGPLLALVGFTGTRGVSTDRRDAGHERAGWAHPMLDD